MPDEPARHMKVGDEVLLRRRGKCIVVKLVGRAVGMRKWVATQTDSRGNVRYFIVKWPHNKLRPKES